MIDTSLICFNGHEQRDETEVGYERKQKIHYDLIVNLDLEPCIVSLADWRKFGKCLLNNKRMELEEKLIKK